MFTRQTIDASPRSRDGNRSQKKDTSLKLKEQTPEKLKTPRKFFVVGKDGKEEIPNFAKPKSPRKKM